MSFLFRGVITVQEQQPVKQAPAPQKQDLSKLRATHEEYNNNVSSTAGPGNPNGGAVPQQAPPQKLEPIRHEKKILPNDPCPCGSGKKYKKCHGTGIEA